MKIIATILVIGVLGWFGWIVLSNTAKIANETPVTEQPSVSKAAQAALDEGYTDLVSKGIPLLACSKDDSIFTSEEFDAKNENGKVVHIKVCCGLFFKGCTVRH